MHEVQAITGKVKLIRNKDKMYAFVLDQNHS